MATLLTAVKHSEAIDFLEMADYDAVILDIMMPKMDGSEVLRHIRNPGKSAPVLFLTAKDSVADKVKELDSGADDYFIKPFSLEELTARIRAMTRKKFNITANIYEASLKVIQRQGRKMSKLIEDMLCVALLEQNKDSYSREMVDFSTLVQDICMDVALLKSKNIVLGWEIEPGIFLMGNAMLLTRMVTNLTSNGYRYGKQAARFSEGTGLGLAMVKDIAK